MSTFFQDIRGALTTQLSTLPGSPDIAWENDEYDENSRTLFLRATLLPAETVQACIGGSGQDLHDGILQIDVFTPRGEGVGTYADQVADHLLRGAVLTQNTVDVRVKNASIGVGIKDQHFYILPVSIRYQAFTNART